MDTTKRPSDEQQQLISPRPGTPGRGVGGEGSWPGIVRPPHPRPLSPEAGERGDYALPFASLVLTIAGAALLALAAPGLHAGDKDQLPSQFSKEQKDNLLRFLQQHEKPDRYIPAGAKIVSSQPVPTNTKVESPPVKTIKQYMVQITPHRPVPGQEEVQRADVVYYRPNPEKGKPGITVRHTVDLATGNQVGPTEVLFNSHTPISHEELAEAVDLARQKTPVIEELYKQREKSNVRWEYLQLMINRKHGANEPGDRVVRLVFTASAIKDQAEPMPTRVIVNLTKGTVTSDDR